MRISILLAACMITSSLNGNPAAGETGLREGQFFPDLRLPALADGALNAVSDFRGKKTLLLVFSSW